MVAPIVPFATMPTVLPSIALLEQRTAQLMELWRVPPGPLVRVSWNQRLTTTAGRAFCAEQRLELNPTLLAGHPAEIPGVLVHEAAHLAAHRLFGQGVAAHGRHWRGLMRIAGEEPTISHDLPVPRGRVVGQSGTSTCAFAMHAATVTSRAPCIMEPAPAVQRIAF